MKIQILLLIASLSAPATKDSSVLEAAVGADLIVMATQGRSGIPHLLIGSVAERVVRHSTKPVLTVRAGRASARVRRRSRRVVA